METKEIERRLRRDCDTLAIVGLGVMAFGIWSALRTAITFFFQISSLQEEFAGTGHATAYIIAAGIISLMALTVDLWLRLYIGRSARAEGLQQKRKTGYLFAAGFLALFSVLILSAMCYILFGADPALEGEGALGGLRLSGVIIELTSVVTLIEMIAASVRVKRMRRELEKRRG